MMLPGDGTPHLTVVSAKGHSRIKIGIKNGGKHLKYKKVTGGGGNPQVYMYKKGIFEKKCLFLFCQFLLPPFCSTMTVLHLKCPHHFLFHLFYSTFLFHCFITVLFLSFLFCFFILP